MVLGPVADPFRSRVSSPEWDGGTDRPNGSERRPRPSFRGGAPTAPPPTMIDRSIHRSMPRSSTLVVHPRTQTHIPPRSVSFRFVGLWTGSDWFRLVLWIAAVRRLVQLVFAEEDPILANEHDDGEPERECRLERDQQSERERENARVVGLDSLSCLRNLGRMLRRQHIHGMRPLRWALAVAILMTAATQLLVFRATNQQHAPTADVDDRIDAPMFTNTPKFRNPSSLVRAAAHALTMGGGTNTERVLFDDKDSATGVPAFMPIYWINLDGSKERRNLMEGMFEALGAPKETTHRVSATDIPRVQKLLAEQQLVFENGITLFPQDDELTYYHHIRDEYTYVEAAVLLSQLDAIRRAYEAGYEHALVLEDDAKLSSDFFKSWKNQTAMAPSGWKILQFALINPTVVKHGLNLPKDPWISWQPDHWAARAYLINRDGMEDLLGGLLSKDPETGKDVWTFRGRVSLVADELIYYYLKEAYTSTYPWVDSFYVDTQVQADTPDLDYRLPTVDYLPTFHETPPRTEKLLVFGYGHWETVRDALAELEWIRMDALTLRALHDPSANLEWYSTVIVHDRGLLSHPKVRNATAALPSFVRLTAHLSNHASNKFSYLQEHLARMDSFDLLLLKDHDQRITGFPWNAFVDEKGDAVVAGPLRQTVHEWLISSHNGTHRQSFPLLDGFHWKEFKLCLWSTRMFEHLKTSKTTYLESYLVLLDAKFARWFFEQTLLPRFVNQTSHWGPDMMWCGASREWAPHRPSCRLVPVVSKYEEPQTDGLRGKNTTLLLQKGKKMLRFFKEQHWRFSGWMNDAKLWKKHVDGLPHERIQYVCMSEPYNISSCRSFDDCDLEACVSRMVELYGSGNWGKDNRFMGDF